jgi:hypothetical protein
MCLGIEKMKTVLTYSLGYKDVTDKLPVLPVCHDAKITEIKFDGNNLMTISADLDDLSYQPADLKFKARKVNIEIQLDEECDCMIKIEKSFPKKQFKEKTKGGYGLRANCYDIKEFLQIYQKYNLEILDNMVGFNKVFFLLGGTGKIRSIKMNVTCDKIKYTFMT